MKLSNLLRSKRNASEVKPMGIRSTCYPPNKPKTYNEMIEEKESEDFERVWADFKGQIKTHRTRQL